MHEKILVIEDDFDIQEIISETLSANGYKVELAEDGLVGIEKFNKEKYDLIILDIMMPKINGYVVCEMIRKVSDVPIIMLTALEEEQDQIRGFELKIDDYITKPFSINLLLKRVEAVLRRTNKDYEDHRVYFEEIAVDKSSYRVWVNNENVELTTKEFEILETLIRNKGRVLTREVLLEKIWGYDFYGDARVIDTHIKNLRHKLNTDYIKTIRGVGYKLEK
ncbi:transcriptional regulator [Fervidicella metallireducens AeB]|uniref:Stage 0 sporulation protein A homolog n=1 Tax=Fervidicella metallireducens AeB TaxID=1403537 RepID=A0A017RTM6_9CLOT|nr:response regulator transcription factor [Fervidicella metallireducens]EYE87255.1 transcriptional regulator [Fervidicella metallireducens AeB]